MSIAYMRGGGQESSSTSEAMQLQQPVELLLLSALAIITALAISTKVTLQFFSFPHTDLLNFVWIISLYRKMMRFRLVVITHVTRICTP